MVRLRRARRHVDVDDDDLMRGRDKYTVRVDSVNACSARRASKFWGAIGKTFPLPEKIKVHRSVSYTPSFIIKVTDSSDT